jgi:hypothetical protein
MLIGCWPGHRTDLDPVHLTAAVGPRGQQSHDGVLRGLAPQVVQDDVGLGGRGGQRPGHRIVIAGQLDNIVGTSRGERAQTDRVASGVPTTRPAPPPGHQHGHRSGVAGRAENEHALPGLDLNAVAQGATYDASYLSHVSN